MNRTCPSGKKGFSSFGLAEDALIDAWTRYEYTPSNGPLNIYPCDDCGQYHFTSRGPMNPRLDQLIKDGTIARQRLANKWDDKLKR